jgi:hypothetical protein
LLGVSTLNTCPTPRDAGGPSRALCVIVAARFCLTTASVRQRFAHRQVQWTKLRGAQNQVLFEMSAIRLAY